MASLVGSIRDLIPRIVTARCHLVPPRHFGAYLAAGWRHDAMGDDFPYLCVRWPHDSAPVMP